MRDIIYDLIGAALWSAVVILIIVLIFRALTNGLV